MFEKTTLCKFFVRKKCTRGNACTFAHGAEDVRSKPNLTKTKLCSRLDSRGTCALGDSCTYAHSISELRRPSTGASSVAATSSASRTEARAAHDSGTGAAEVQRLLAEVRQDMARISQMIQYLQ